MLKSRLTAFSPSRLLLRHHHLHLLIWRLGQRVMWMWYDMYCGNFNMVCLTRTNVNGSVVCRNISCQQFNHADWAIESLNYIHIGQFLIYLPCQHLVPIQEAVLTFILLCNKKGSGGWHCWSLVWGLCFVSVWCVFYYSILNYKDVCSVILTKQL